MAQKYKQKAAPKDKTSNKGLKQESRRTAASGKGSKVPKKGINRG